MLRDATTLKEPRRPEQRHDAYPRPFLAAAARGLVSLVSIWASEYEYPSRNHHLIDPVCIRMWLVEVSSGTCQPRWRTVVDLGQPENLDNRSTLIQRAEFNPK
jgi:hypothetical protein